MTDDSQIDESAIRGFLAAFAEVNDATNRVCEFSFDRLPEAPDIDTAMRHHVGAGVTRVDVTDLIDWQPEVTAALHLHLFGFLSSRQESRSDWKESLYALDHFKLFDESSRAECGERFLARLRRVVGPARVTRVEVFTSTWYAMYWDDFVFSLPDRRYLLHLGVSD